jgi:hypothetical protein
VSTDAAVPADVVPLWARVQRGPVGVDGEPIVLTHLRAALAVLGGDAAAAAQLRTAKPAALAARVVERERQRWAATAGDPRWQLGAGLVGGAQEEAVLALLLRAPQVLDEATAVLRCLPRFGDRDDDHLRRVSTWAHHLYPTAGTPPDGFAGLDPQPSLLHGALLSLALDPRHDQLRAALGLAAAAVGQPRILLRLVRAASGIQRWLGCSTTCSATTTATWQR